MTKSKIIVLARFKETNDHFFTTLKKYTYYDDIIIYDKHRGINLLPNVGREVHTILWHIINNYDNLSDEILFAQYDSWDHFRLPSANKGHKGMAHLKYFLTTKIHDFIGVRPGRWRKMIHTARGTMSFNWLNFYSKLFDKAIDNHEIAKIMTIGPTKYSIFRVTKQAILRHPKEFYEKCISLVDSNKNIKNVYYFEFLWRLLFTDYGCKNLSYNYLNNQYVLFGSNKPKNILQKLQGNIFGPIFLNENGVIAGNDVSLYSSNNESFWKIIDNNLMFFRSDGGLTSSFDLQNIKKNNKIFGNFHYSNDNELENHVWLEFLDHQSNY